MPPLDDRRVLAFSIFWAPPHEIASHVVHFLARPAYPRELRISQLSGPPNTAPQTYNPPFQEYQLWLPDSCPTVTGFYPNMEDGAATVVQNIVRHSGGRALSLRISGGKTEHPICEWVMHDGKPATRLIRVTKDGGWEFYESGKTLSFEDTDHYKQRQIRRRFDAEMAMNYCQQLGVDVSSARFWATHNVTTMKIRA